MSELITKEIANKKMEERLEKLANTSFELLDYDINYAAKLGKYKIEQIHLTEKNPIYKSDPKVIEFVKSKLKENGYDIREFAHDNELVDIIWKNDKKTIERNNYFINANDANANAKMFEDEQTKRIAKYIKEKYKRGSFKVKLTPTAPITKNVCTKLEENGYSLYECNDGDMVIRWNNVIKMDAIMTSDDNNSIDITSTNLTSIDNTSAKIIPAMEANKLSYDKMNDIQKRECIIHFNSKIEESIMDLHNFVNISESCKAFVIANNCTDMEKKIYDDYINLSW